MVEKIHQWDKSLTVAEIEALSPAAKGLRCRTALTRKLEEMELWLGSAALLEKNRENIPWSRPHLREWHDDIKKLWSWKKNTVDKPEGKNHD